MNKMNWLLTFAVVLSMPLVLSSCATDGNEKKVETDSLYQKDESSFWSKKGNPALEKLKKKHGNNIPMKEFSRKERGYEDEEENYSEGELKHKLLSGYEINDYSIIDGKDKEGLNRELESISKLCMLSGKVDSDNDIDSQETFEINESKNKTDRQEKMKVQAFEIEKETGKTQVTKVIGDNLSKIEKANQGGKVERYRTIEVPAYGKTEKAKANQEADGIVKVQITKPAEDEVIEVPVGGKTEKAEANREVSQSAGENETIEVPAYGKTEKAKANQEADGIVKAQIDQSAEGYKVIGVLADKETEPTEADQEADGIVKVQITKPAEKYEVIEVPEDGETESTEASREIEGIAEAQSAQVVAEGNETIETSVDEKTESRKNKSNELEMSEEKSKSQEIIENKLTQAIKEEEKNEIELKLSEKSREINNDCFEKIDNGLDNIAVGKEKMLLDEKNNQKSFIGKHYGKIAASIVAPVLVYNIFKTLNCFPNRNIFGTNE